MSKGPFSALSEDLSSNYLPTNQKEQEQIFSQIINSNEIILNLKVSYKNKRITKLWEYVTISHSIILQL